jgi:hypothetical protein
LKQVLFDVKDVVKMITSGKKLILAADENQLNKLPSGSWIAGTTPYFMGEQGGILTNEKIYVTELPDFIKSSKIKLYNENNIHQIYNDAPRHGFTVLIIPAASSIHFTFALNAPNFPNFATRPLIGWIAGDSFQESEMKPKIYDGRENVARENGAIALHVELPDNKLAEVKILNIFEQGDGDTITFPQDGFSATTAFVNGEPVNFAEYLCEKAIDTRLLLMADLYGAMLNVSFKAIDCENNKVDFYAPVFAGFRYKIAKPINDYFGSFLKQVPQDAENDVFLACNCILNFLYAELEGRKFANFTGPITFGEIAYQLLNQTLVYLTIEDI